FICSGSSDNRVCVWDVDNNKQIQSFNDHLSYVMCVKFSSYHYHNHRQYIICSSSWDKTIRITNMDHMTKQFVYGMLKHQNHYIFSMDMKIFNNDNNNKMNNIGVIGGNGYTICSGSSDRTIRIWDIETTKQLNVFKGHEN
ncbi:WD-40 repeat protein, partial [Reticulomyxa filosa]